MEEGMKNKWESERPSAKLIHNDIVISLYE